MTSGVTDVAAVSDLLKRFDARLMRGFPVSTRVNHAANDDEAPHLWNLPRFRIRSFRIGTAVDSE
jgi:hypothetical protein